MKQPALGIISTALIIAVSLGFVHLFSFALFTGWVAYYLLCLIPMQIVTAVLWKCQHPAFAGKPAQPLKGILLLITCMVVGAVVAYAYWIFAGASISPPAPMLAMCTI